MVSICSTMSNSFHEQLGLGTINKYLCCINVYIKSLTNHHFDLFLLR